MGGGFPLHGRVCGLFCVSVGLPAHVCGLVCWFWCVTINSLRWIGVRQTDAALVVVDRKKARVAAPPTG